MTKPRLIDANELTDGKGVFSSVVQFKHIDGELTAYVTVEDIIKVIENQPTAYDLDKVVEQLEEEKNCGMDLIDTDYAIEIVKGGGGMIICYTVAMECKNPVTMYTCYKCGKCGRKFVDGIMVDDGGTTPDDEE